MLKPNLVVAVKSNFNALEAGVHDQIRGTWGQALRGRGEVKFFLGRPTMEIGGAAKSVHPTWENSYNPKSDEVILECQDGYESLVWKTRAICKWMTDRVISHLMIVHPAAKVNVGRVFSSNYQFVDYAGNFNFEPSDAQVVQLHGPG